MANLRDNNAERKIYFYRAVPLDPDELGDDWKFPRKQVCRAIADLAGSDAFYLDEGDDKITCADVHRDKPPQCLKFYAIRRTNLPSRDSGGVIQDLDLAEDEGLAEAVHLRLYPNGVIGFEAFFYGPRVGRIETFLNERCFDALGGQIVIRQLYRHDVVERALKFEDIRLLRVKMHPSIGSLETIKTAGLDGILDTAEQFHTAVYADVTLRSEADDQSFTERVKKLIRRMKKDDEDNPARILEALDISGRNPESGVVEPLNLLEDKLQRVAYIPRQNQRTRALDSEAAFETIHEAYNDVKDHLSKDALGA